MHDISGGPVSVANDRLLRDFAYPNWIGAVSPDSGEYVLGYRNDLECDSGEWHSATLPQARSEHRRNSDITATDLVARTSDFSW